MQRLILEYLGKSSTWCAIGGLIVVGIVCFDQLRHYNESANVAATSGTYYICGLDRLNTLQCKLENEPAS